MTRARVLFYVPSLGGGGAERATVDLAGSLDQARFESIIVVDRVGPNDYVVGKGVATEVLGSSGVLDSVRKFRGVIQRQSPDVVYTALPHLGFIAALVRLLVGTRSKLAVSVHNNLDAEFRELSGGRFWRRVTPWTYRRASAVVCVSSGVARQQREVFGAAPEKVVVIPNAIAAVSPEATASEPPLHPWFASGSRVLLGVGRLVPQKGFPVLLRSFARVSAMRDNVKLLILGDGPERDKLVSLSRDLGIDHSVDLVGRVDNPSAFMERAALLVSTSTYEGFGMVLVEAIAAGARVVSFDCDFGPGEILDGGECGRLVRNGDIDALTEAIVTELDRPVQAIDEEARARVVARYSPSETARRAELVFSSLLGGKPIA